MSKKVLILSASPRKGGNSDMLCDRFAAGARAAGNDAEKIFLRDKQIGYCTGCGACYLNKKACPQKDDMAEVMDAQLKTLIDRTCSRYTEISGKDFYFIVTAADDSIEAMEPTLAGLRGFTSCLSDVRERGVIYGVGVWHAGEIAGSGAMEQAYEAGRNA